MSVTTVYPGEIETSLHDHELDHMPDWYRMDRRAPAGPLGEQVVEAVENDRRELFYPPLVRMLRVVNGISPRLGDLMLRRILGRSVGAAMSLPLKPPIKPQLARSAKELPEGESWRYEPKFDGFRTIVFRDGDDVQLQSRNGRPMNRYFPDVVEQVLELPHDRLVLDGEMMVVVDGVQEFDLLSQRIHPAASRVERLREETPAALVAFDLLAEGDEVLCPLPYDERRERLAAVVADPVELTPDDARPRRRRRGSGSRGCPRA